MLPNLLEATQDYWKKLNKLEAAYQRGEVSLEEVDARVAKLMAELGQERRASLNYVLGSWKQLWQAQREAIIGVAILAIATYAWTTVS